MKYYSAQRLDLFAWCVRLGLSRLLVGFRTHFKSLHFHSFIHFILYRALAYVSCCIYVKWYNMVSVLKVEGQRDVALRDGAQDSFTVRTST